MGKKFLKAFKSSFFSSVFIKSINCIGFPFPILKTLNGADEDEEGFDYLNQNWNLVAGLKQHL